MYADRKFPKNFLPFFEMIRNYPQRLPMMSLIAGHTKTSDVLEQIDMSGFKSRLSHRVIYDWWWEDWQFYNKNKPINISPTTDKGMGWGARLKKFPNFSQEIFTIVRWGGEIIGYSPYRVHSLWKWFIHRKLLLDVPIDIREALMSVVKARVLSCF